MSFSESPTLGTVPLAAAKAGELGAPTWSRYPLAFECLKGKKKCKDDNGRVTCIPKVAVAHCCQVYECIVTVTMHYYYVSASSTTAT